MSSTDPVKDAGDHADAKHKHDVLYSSLERFYLFELGCDALADLLAGYYNKRKNPGNSTLQELIDEVLNINHPSAIELRKRVAAHPIIVKACEGIPS